MRVSARSLLKNSDVAATCVRTVSFSRQSDRVETERFDEAGRTVGRRGEGERRKMLKREQSERSKKRAHWKTYVEGEVNSGGFVDLLLEDR